MSHDSFVPRHLGPREGDVSAMLEAIGVQSLNELMEQVVPHDIRLPKELRLPEALTEQEYLNLIHEKGRRNKLFRSLIGQGYYGTTTPPVILRNVFENPTWYTSYTPYQAEISQGRLEALLNFQTMIVGLTGMDMANASLLDEGTAAAEAMSMMRALRSRQAVKEGRNVIFVDDAVFPHTVAVIETRSRPLGVEVVRGSYADYAFTGREFGVVLQYPNMHGQVADYRAFVERVHGAGALVAVAADLLALTLLKAPGEWGADIVVGSTQRFGVPMGFGGPHAAYFATREEFKRSLPGRIIGVSVDRHGNRALRMALQTREQHIKREKATSNICTAQALLAVMAGMYAVYHGPEGLTRIARTAHGAAVQTARALREMGCKVLEGTFFDTIVVKLESSAQLETLRKEALTAEMNFHYADEKTVALSFDELSTVREVSLVVSLFAKAIGKPAVPVSTLEVEPLIPAELRRDTPFLQEKIFNTYRSETEMMRYIHRLANKDIALNHSMIPLGSCTMKLNSAASMIPLSWSEFGAIHPFAPEDQTLGYRELIEELEGYLAEITGFAATSLQPNSGASGEYAGLLVIRAYQAANGEGHRNTVLIPSSAHGTNPASAVMAGLDIVIVACDARGNIDVEDLRAKAVEHRETLSAFMVTYPSTHGIFESRIREMMDIIHENGGQVYMDGANMNAQVGLTSPGYIGADVCHLNLHKTFASPHGGGGPGVGPICVASHLAPFLPGHSVVKTGGNQAIKAVSSAPWGSAMILPITYAYIRLMGASGLRQASEYAILGANYIVAKLKGYYSAVYTGETGYVGHEVIVDCRHCKSEYDVETGDIARRLMDYGFHAPTLSFPVHETLMVEPTESESKEELDRFCEALITIRAEMEAIKSGAADREDNLLKNAPHTAVEVVANEWSHGYSREEAAYPLVWLRENKYWPSVSRIDAGYGDRNLFCTCEF